MDQPLAADQSQQYINLTNHLISLGVSTEQIYTMSSRPLNGGLLNNNLKVSGTSNIVKHNNAIAPNTAKDIAYEEGLLLKMFSTFCGKDPQSAKELSIAFTKFSRWIQSTVDKSEN